MHQLNDRWVTLLYESCSEAVVNLQPRRQLLNQDEEGLLNLSEAVVYLYDELHRDSRYQLPNEKEDEHRVLH
jgi:hypothetical protein